MPKRYGPVLSYAMRAKRARVPSRPPWRARRSIVKSLGVTNKRIRRVVNKMAETKIEMRSVCNNAGVKHNQCVNLSNNLLYTDVGPRGEMINDVSAGNHYGTRVGKKLYCKGLSIKIKCENYQAQPNLMWRIMILKNKMGYLDIAGTDNIYEGAHTDKMMDYVNTDHYAVMYSKTFNVKAAGPGAGAGSATSGQEAGSTHVSMADGSQWIARGKKYIKIWLPINKTLVYNPVQNNTNWSEPLNMKLQLVAQVYSAYTAPTTGSSDLGFIDASTKMYFKDI